MCQRELRPGLRIHADAERDDMDTVAHGKCQPGLHLVLLLEGKLDLCYDRQRICLAAHATGRCQHKDCALPFSSCEKTPPQAFLLHIQKPVCFSRRLRTDVCARRVSLCMSTEWLRYSGEACARRTDEMDAGLTQLCARHLCLMYWQPTHRSLVLAEQMLQPPNESAALSDFYRESRAIDLFVEVLRSLREFRGEGAEICAPLASLDSRSWRRMRQLRHWLASEEAMGVPLSVIAKRIGMHESTMQRQFRAAFGSSVAEFVRESALQRARLVLEGGGVSVQEAADHAGYRSAANFATAYKRRFGFTPKQARNGSAGM